GRMQPALLEIPGEVIPRTVVRRRGPNPRRECRDHWAVLLDKRHRHPAIVLHEFVVKLLRELLDLRVKWIPSRRPEDPDHDLLACGLGRRGANDFFLLGLIVEHGKERRAATVVAATGRVATGVVRNARDGETLRHR